MLHTFLGTSLPQPKYSNIFQLLHGSTPSLKHRKGQQYNQTGIKLLSRRGEAVPQFDYSRDATQQVTREHIRPPKRPRLARCVLGRICFLTFDMRAFSHGTQHVHIHTQVKYIYHLITLTCISLSHCTYVPCLYIHRTSKNTSSQ